MPEKWVKFINLIQPKSVGGLMRDWLSILVKGGFICLVLAVLSIVFVVIVPVFLGDSVSVLYEIIPVIAMLLVMLSGLLVTIAWIFGLYEILTAKNDSNWKLIWAVVVFILGIIGLAIYMSIARKELKA